MTFFTARTEFRVPCDEPSHWLLSFERFEREVIIGLHYGGKDRPAHTASIPVDDFRELVSRLIDLS